MRRGELVDKRRVRHPKKIFFYIKHSATNLPNYKIEKKYQLTLNLINGSVVTLCLFMFGKLFRMDRARRFGSYPAQHLYLLRFFRFFLSVETIDLAFSLSRVRVPTY